MASVNTTTTLTCENSYFHARTHLNNAHREALAVFMLVSMLLNLILSSSVMYALVKTGQVRNASMRLIFLLCISDCCLALFGQPLFVVLLLSNNYNNITAVATQSCNFASALVFFIRFCAHNSAYIIGLIGYDRYLRMKYLNLYQTVVKPWKLYFATILLIFLSLLQTTMDVVGIQQVSVYNVKVVLGT